MARLLECGLPITEMKALRNEENTVRTVIGLNRLFRCPNARRFLLPLGVLAAAWVAIPMTLVLAAVIVDGMFVDNPAVFELDGNLASGDTFSGVTGTRDWA